MKPTNPSPAVGRHRLGLFPRLALTFLLVLTLLAVIYSYLTSTLVNRYFEATYERLNRDVAAHIVRFMAPFNKRGVDPKGADAIFFHAMVTNPSAEVYLLDAAGHIDLAHDPDGLVRRRQVDLAPIRRYIQEGGRSYIKGDNPRNPNEQAIFSAAPVAREGRLQGYVYVILISSTYSSVMGMLRQSYVLQWGAGTILITLLAALIIGLVAVYRQTRRLNYVIERVQQFREGDLDIRIQIKPNSELAPLAETFNGMAETIKQNVEQLRTAEQVRRNLVATVSHDLRTPMASIYGYAQLLSTRPSLSDLAKADYATIILQSTSNVMKLVDELFELSKLESQETKPHREPFVLAEVVMETYAKFQVIAQQKSLTFSCEDCQIPTLCFADVGMTERVLQNLVENAIHYAPTGSFVRIALRTAPTRLIVSVQNTVDTLTDPVRAYLLGQAPAVGSTERPTGVGLGLTIVRKLLSLHDTALRVAFTDKQTIKFTFSLPAYQPPIG